MIFQKHQRIILTTVFLIVYIISTVTITCTIPSTANNIYSKLIIQHDTIIADGIQQFTKEETVNDETQYSNYNPAIIHNNNLQKLQL